MKTLIIHPQDKTTEFLRSVYNDHDCTVITQNIGKSQLKKLMIDHDQIIMLGHGTEYGLIGHGRLIIDSNFVYLLRTKRCIGIWCYADKFFFKYGLGDLCTGMIISEADEAKMLNIPFSLNSIKRSNEAFAYALRNLVKGEFLETDYPIVDEISQYNKVRIYLKTL